MRVAATIALSPEERAVLSRWARRRDRGSARATRARIILSAAAGMEDREIARTLRVNRLTVARWRRRFLISRLRGIVAGARSSPRLGRIPEEKVRAIVRRSLTSPPREGPGWTSRSLGRHYGVSHSTVRRIWDSYQIRPLRRGTWSLRADPEAPLLPCDVLGVYLHPPTYALATLLGRPESGSRSPPLMKRPAQGHFAPRRFWDQASTQLSQILSDLPDSKNGGTAGRGGSKELLRFLSGIHHEAGASAVVRVVIAGPDRQGDSGVARWGVHHPNFRLELLPDPERWKARALREIEAAGAQGGLSRPTHARLAGARSLARSLSSYGAGGVPYEWIATREEVQAGKAGAHLRYDLASTGHPSLPDTSPATTSVRSDPADVVKARELAHTVLRKCLGVRSGEQVTIESWTATLGQANAFVLEALRIGARPMLLYQDEATYWAAATECRPDFLARLGAHRRAAVERTDVLVSFFGPSDRARAHALPRRVQLRLGEYQDAVYRAAARAGSRAVQLAIGRASPASARMYGVDLPSWTKELIDGSLVDPKVLHRRGRRIAARFQDGRSIEIRHSNGTNLRLRLKHRKAELSDGIVGAARHRGDWRLATLPAGVVSVAVDEAYAEGTFRANLSSAAGISGDVDDFVGGEWTFEAGRLVNYAYERGGETFEESFRRAGAGRDRPGSVAVGLNDRLAISPLLEDQGAGTITMHIGRNDPLGGSTRVPWWAWLFLRGGDLTVDGEFLVRKGVVVE
ncbi:MAG: helix-turn-helix domain-containing protein [Thermoplasmata archaeon]